MPFEYDLVQASFSGTIFERLFHWFRIKEILFALRYLNIDLSNRILDYGCGTGHIALTLLNRGYSNLLAYDISPKNISKARLYLDKLDDKFSKFGADLIFTDNKSSLAKYKPHLVIVINVLEYVVNIDDCLSHIKSLSHGAPVIFCMANKNHIIVKLHWLRWLLGSRNIKEIIEHESINRLSSIELEKFLTLQGWNIVKRFSGLLYLNDYWIVNEK